MRKAFINMVLNAFYLLFQQKPVFRLHALRRCGGRVLTERNECNHGFYAGQPSIPPRSGWIFVTGAIMHLCINGFEIEERGIRGLSGR
jgi:hypothetical protein